MRATSQSVPCFTLTQATTGREVLSSLLGLAKATVGELTEAHPALSGRLRGGGPGVSFSEQIRVLEADHPIELVFPFEGCELVGGAAWRASDLLTPNSPHDPHNLRTPPPLSVDPTSSSFLPPPPAGAGIAKLHWRAGAGDLPMHTHPTTDRFIVVLEGRGFFHCSGQDIKGFDGTDVRTIAARSGDVFAFRRGVVHTFSTTAHGMTLISCHLPFLELDDPAQYALPSCRWIAEEHSVSATPPSMVVGGWESLV